MEMTARERAQAITGARNGLSFRGIARKIKKDPGTFLRFVDLPENEEFKLDLYAAHERSREAVLCDLRQGRGKHVQIEWLARTGLDRYDYVSIDKVAEKLNPEEGASFFDVLREQMDAAQAAK